MMEGGKFRSDDEDAVRNLALPRGCEEKEEEKIRLHHFRYDVMAYAIIIQGVSFFLFVCMDVLSRMNSEFVVMSLDRRHFLGLVNILHRWRHHSRKAVCRYSSPNRSRHRNVGHPRSQLPFILLKSLIVPTHYTSDCPLVQEYEIVPVFNPYPANVDKMASSYQCQQMADGI